MGFAQVMQVIGSFGIILLALFIAYKMAKKGTFTGRDAGMKLVSRHGISRTQNLVVAEANGKRHLIAMSDGGNVVVDSWESTDEPEVVVADPDAFPSFSSFLAKAKESASSALADTQWSSIGRKKKQESDDTEDDKTVPAPRGLSLGGNIADSNGNPVTVVAVADVTASPEVDQENTANESTSVRGFGSIDSIRADADLETNSQKGTSAP